MYDTSIVYTLFLAAP